MLPIYRYRWLARIVRSNTNRIPEDTARKWKTGLSAVYCLSAFVVFAFVQSMRSESKEENKKKYGEIDDAHYWLRKWNKDKATIVRFEGFSLDYTEEKYDIEKIREEQREKELMEYNLAETAKKQ